MDNKLEDAFALRWPAWFKGLNQSPMQSNLAFGFECGDGWRDLLWDLCCDIQNLNPPPDFEVTQVKEKFGGLRFYISGGTCEINDRISRAENASYDVCERCGSRGGVTLNESGWLSTRCAKCREGKG